MTRIGTRLAIIALALLLGGCTPVEWAIGGAAAGAVGQGVGAFDGAVNLFRDVKALKPPAAPASSPCTLQSQCPDAWRITP